MARCRVSFTESDGTEHAVEFGAESLYGAVAQAVADFREDPLLPNYPGTMTEFTVAVPPQSNRTSHPEPSGEVGRADHDGRSGGHNEEAEGSHAAENDLRYLRSMTCRYVTLA
jgi:hypothetical protein